MFGNDYIMNEVANLAKFAAKVFFQKDINTINAVDEQGNIIEEGYVKHRLWQLINKGKINEAENLLFENVEKYQNEAMLQIGIEFYGKLATFSEDYLKVCDFSNVEIAEGISDLKKIFAKEKGM